VRAKIKKAKPTETRGSWFGKEEYHYEKERL